MSNRPSVSRLRSLVAASTKAALRHAGFDLVRWRDPYRLDVYRRHYSQDVLDSKPFYNVGAGSFFHPYWTNIDYVSDWYAQAQRDVRHHDLMSLAPLPIESATAQLIYTSHTIEHVTRQAVEVLFREAHRALKVGGVMRVTTGPDAETDFRALQRGDADWFYWDTVYSKPGTFEHIFRAPAVIVPLEERWLHHVASQLAPNDLSESAEKVDAAEIRRLIAVHGFPGVLDELTSRCQFSPSRPGNHISWWTHDRVMDLLRSAGFKSVYRSGRGQSCSPLMRQSDLFDSTHPQMSIYVEAIKS